MRVHLGSDHAGFEVKGRVGEHLRQQGHEVVDHGAESYVDGDDYPPYCIAAAAATVADPGSLGLVVGGSGNGEQIAANKVDGVRAALVWSTETAQLARQHNDANVAGIGARMHPVEVILGLVDTFVGTPFSGDPRHVRRIGELKTYEDTGDLSLPDGASS